MLSERQSEAGDTDVPPLLDPSDVQRALKLSSRRAARELIVREMEHVIIGRTPMTTPRWLAQWLERHRCAPRAPIEQSNGQVVEIGAKRSRAGRRPGPIMPPSRQRAKRP
jgi:hypothetical protein